MISDWWLDLNQIISGKRIYFGNTFLTLKGLNKNRESTYLVASSAKRDLNQIISVNQLIYFGTRPFESLSVRDVPTIRFSEIIYSNPRGVELVIGD